MKPIVDKALGGSLRLFVQKVYEGSYSTRNEEVVLYANANLPNGSTLEQNTLMKRMETYLSTFKEIKQFHTSIYSPRRASIYILNEYNSIRRRFSRLSAFRAYTKAWNAKIVLIFLTVVSTILGFVPFMIGTDKEAFWFPLAAGTIGGLVMSVVGIFFFLPIFVLERGNLRRGNVHSEG